MARKFATAVDLAKNELQNAAVQSLAAAPSSPVKFQLYGNTGDNTFYWYDGTQWVAAKGAAGAVPAGTVTTQAVGDAPVVGVSTNFAREDHKHGREAFGAITAQTAFGAASGNGSAATLARSDHVHGTPTHTNADHAAINLSALAAPTADVNLGNFKITNLASPVGAADATNKGYVDNAVAGISWKDSVRAASTTAYTSPPGGVVAVDGVSIVAADRVLLKNQANPVENGLWKVVSAGNWTRAVDADDPGEMDGAAVFVMEGTVNADTAWVCTTNAPITVGTTALTFAQFAGGGTVTAGAGMTQSGNTLNVIADASITVTADQISRAALTGDVTAAAGANATVIATDVVDNTKLANMPANTFKGNNTASAADPLDLTIAAMQTILAVPALPVTVANGGTGRTTGTLANSLVAVGTTATGAQQSIAPGLTAEVLFGTGSGLPAFRQIALADVQTLTTALAAKAAKFSQATIGGATAQTVTHNLNTQAVVVSVFRTLTPWEEIECDVEHTTVNTVTLRFTVAPATNEFTCVVIG